ncbi:class I SAM-dependent methyltransferase [Brachybacterium sp. NPDC056505]|uniref:class I SAM-dependent methyltransferase n=1 Tax=Brachybacterium sp. NPDC056505 TaxID=3345843 RepID=UPI003671F2FC
MTQRPDQRRIDARLHEYYGSGHEGQRLRSSAGGVLEFRRTQEIVAAQIDRIASETGRSTLRIADVGGATGAHAAPLAALGHVVTLVDPVPAQVREAKTISEVTALVGDARDLPLDDSAHDVVLLLGPLYHLAEAVDRARALTEARRTLRPGGILIAAGISRLSSFTDTYLSAAADGADEGGDVAVWDDAWQGILADGWADIPEAPFPFGHFHTSAELAAELRDAGFAGVTVHGVEGPIGVAAELLGTEDRALEALMGLACRSSEHPLLRDISPHLLAVGRAPVPSA